MSNVTRDGSASSSGADHVVTSRRGGSLSTTSPTTSAMSLPSIRLCSQREPAFQSETLLWPQ